MAWFWVPGMKFGFRKPSLKKRIAARTSLKRYVRHNLGLKAPRGWGWVTNPKKAAYNRVYNRTTFGLPSVGTRRRSSSAEVSSGCGCLAILAAVGVAAVAWVALITEIGDTALVLGGGFIALCVAIYYLDKRSKQSMEQRRASQEAAARQARFDNLSQRFGAESAAAIMQGRYWQGCTSEMVVEALGPPADVKERVFKTKTKTTYCYNQIAKNRFALKIHFENGVVIGWDQL